MSHQSTEIHDTSKRTLIGWYFGNGIQGLFVGGFGLLALLLWLPDRSATYLILVAVPQIMLGLAAAVYRWSNWRHARGWRWILYGLNSMVIIAFVTSALIWFGWIPLPNGFKFV